MPGPAPKESTQRRRRNVPASGEWITLPSLPFEGERPKLPSRLLDGKRPLQATLDTWEHWWTSPMAHMWQKADWDGLLHLIILIDAYNRRAVLDLLKEIRLQKDIYGLTPKGRLSLRWRLPELDDGDLEQDTSPKGRWDTLRVVG